MISFIRFKSHLLHRSKLLFFQILDFVGENLLSRESGINAISLDRDNKVSSIFHEHSSVEAKNSSLIRLGNISEDGVDHVKKHSVFLRVSGVFNDGNDVWSLFSHVHEVSARSLGELHSVNNTFGSDQVRNVANCSSRSSSEIKDL